MQRLQVIGNLGADAEVREKNGKKFVKFRVCDTQKWTAEDGTVSEQSTWISCILSGDGGNLLQYLRRGVKVWVEGRPSYNVYSSPSERRMVAGVDLSVISVELCGGSSDDVPRRLVEPSTGRLIDVFKSYWVKQERPALTCLQSERGGRLFNVDKNGFLTEQQVDNAAADSEQK